MISTRRELRGCGPAGLGRSAWGFSSGPTSSANNLSCCFKSSRICGEGGATWRASVRDDGSRETKFKPRTMSQTAASAAQAVGCGQKSSRHQAAGRGSRVEGRGSRAGSGVRRVQDFLAPSGRNFTQRLALEALLELFVAIHLISS